MKQIRIRYDESKEKEMISSLKLLLNVDDIKSISAGVKLLLDRICSNSKANNNIEKSFNEESCLLRKSIRIGDKEYQELLNLSVKHCWSFSKEVRFRLAHTLNDDFDLFDPELREFNLCRHAINRIGRNLRNILVENQNIIMDKELFAFDVNELRNEIITLNKQIDNYVTLCGNRKISSRVGKMYASKD